MKTIDIHTHLLSPEVRFDRLYDRVALLFFARNLGIDPGRLKADPYREYVRAMAGAVERSEHITQTCLFGVDARRDAKGRVVDRDRTVCAMTEDVLEVANDHPGLFIPFLSVNPLRPDALERIDEYAERGCRGAKFLQNYWGVDLNDERLVPYYERLKARDLPLIIHIGSEYSIHSYAPFEQVEMLELPVASGVRVIAAHMGLGRINHHWRFWRNLSRHPDHFDRDYHRLLELLTTHDNLFADISAILAPLRARALRHLSRQTQVHSKLLFGTDYPVPFNVRFNTHDLDRRTCRRLQRVDNPFDRYARLILEYFPDDNPIYSNYRKIWRQADTGDGDSRQGHRETAPISPKSVNSETNGGEGSTRFG